MQAKSSAQCLIDIAIAFLLLPVYPVHFLNLYDKSEHAGVGMGVGVL